MQYFHFSIFIVLPHPSLKLEGTPHRLWVYALQIYIYSNRLVRKLHVEAYQVLSVFTQCLSSFVIPVCWKGLPHVIPAAPFRSCSSLALQLIKVSLLNASQLYLVLSVCRSLLYTELLAQLCSIAQIPCH